MDTFVHVGKTQTELEVHHLLITDTKIDNPATAAVSASFLALYTRTVHRPEDDDNPHSKITEMSLTTPPSSLGVEQGKSQRGRAAFQFESLTASPPRSRTHSNASPAVKLERRRGHHHKHSLSHQFFLPPTDRARLSLPASLPIPTWQEVLASCNSHQRLQLLWSVLHLMVSFAVFKFNNASLAVASLSKCISFDAFGVASVAAFEVLDNFPVWRTSTIKRSFGLKRAEVVIRFGAAVYLTYSGVELVREVVEHVIIGGGHGHGSTDDIHLDAHSLSGENLSLSMLITIIITLFAAVVFKNHSELSEALQIEDVPNWARNPFWSLTLAPAATLLIFGVSGTHLHPVVDHAIAAAIATAFLWIGVVLILRLGAILLMTYPTLAVQDLYQTIEEDDSVDSIEGSIWQVWSGLVVVALRMHVRGGEEIELRLRSRVNRYVRDILGGGYGSGKHIKYEVRIECERVD